MLQIKEAILTKNPCYTAEKKIEVKGLMLHSVGCPIPAAATFLEPWNKETFERACVHAFIDAYDGVVYQTLPWNHRGWHCGKGVKGCGNNTHIGIEMCEPECLTYTSDFTFECSNPELAREMAARTYDSAVLLFAMLCREYNLDPMEDGVILSHLEGYNRGIATHHKDPEHFWTQLGLEYTMDTFRADVNEIVQEP